MPNLTDAGDISQVEFYCNHANHKNTSTDWHGYVKAFDELLPTPSVRYPTPTACGYINGHDVSWTIANGGTLNTPVKWVAPTYSNTHNSLFFTIGWHEFSVGETRIYHDHSISDVMDGNLNGIATSFATHMSSAVDGGLGDSGDNPNASASGTSLPPTTDHRRKIRKTLEKKPSVECICPQKLYFNLLEFNRFTMPVHTWIFMLIVPPQNPFLDFFIHDLPSRCL